MKVVIGLAVVVGLGALIVLGILSLLNADQKAPADEIRNSVKPGMTWEQVVDIRQPRKYTLLRMSVPGGKTLPGDFDRDKIAAAVAKGAMAEGFAFEYRFSGSEAVEVVFGADGVVLYVADLPTLGDLLNLSTR